MNATKTISKTKEKALEKMLNEMNEKHTSTEDAIHNWLCDQDDDELFKGVLKEDRTIKGSVDYCASKARKHQKDNVAMVDDETVFSWIKEYFILEKVETKKVSAKVTTSAKQTENKPKPVKPKKQPYLEGEQLDLLKFL